MTSPALDLQGPDPQGVARRRLGLRRLLRLAGTVLLVAGWAVYLRPAALGGRTDFVIVSGISMLPTMREGDLVVLRKQESYHRGDVITYRVPKGDPGAGLKVIHRIVGGSARAGFNTQGDNNPGTDPWHPKSADILGKRWFRVPGFGQYLVRLRDPLPLSIVTSLLVFLTVVLRRSKRGRAKPVSEAEAEAELGTQGESVPEAAPVPELAPVAAPEPAALVAAASNGLSSNGSPRHRSVSSNGAEPTLICWRAPPVEPEPDRALPLPPSLSPRRTPPVVAGSPEPPPVHWIAVHEPRALDATRT